MSSPKAENFETPRPPPVVTSSYTTLPALVAFALLAVVVCFVGFGILYSCRCCFLSVIHTWAFQQSASGTTLVRLSRNNNNASSSSPNYRGLDPSLLQTFPTFLYASVKNLRKGKNYSLECAICLLEFEDDSLLRLLTACCHVFHQDCIDLWLRSHKTCPVCRVDLDSPANLASPKLQEVVLEDDHNDNVVEERRGTGDDVCIEVKEGEGDHHHGGDDNDERLFPRSHSTGHSVVMIRGGAGEQDDKYTLRLPEHAALKVVRGGRNCTKSCSSYKDMAAPSAAAAAAPCSNCGYVQSQTVFGCSSRSTAENT
ncbi:RING-H2 finger protein ATL29-like [Lotus japonicus]|uniref:RING-H2 finger protein ATL29-like n=1 Tax=Lotus japonicus TaxID=34305 RepID=UPI00258E1FB4|nr:RING-H2 finger protein ATL29-like [Lotus japonicus]